MTRTRLCALGLTAVLAAAAACGGNKPPVAAPTPPPPAPTANPTTTPPRPPEPIPPPPPVPPDPILASDPLVTGTLDEINKMSPLKPAYFALDSADIDAVAQQALTDDAQILKKYGKWVITVEGHCDERGPAEYNLALGERRALAAKTYLISLGISADRLRTVSYGKEFPFDPNHDDSAWSKNRRAHFVVTAK